VLALYARIPLSSPLPECGACKHSTDVHGYHASQAFSRRARKIGHVSRVGEPALAENWSRAHGWHCAYSAGAPARDRYEGGTDWRRPGTFRAARSMTGPCVSSVRKLAICNGNAREGYDREHILALPGGQARERCRERTGWRSPAALHGGLIGGHAGGLKESRANVPAVLTPPPRARSVSLYRVLGGDVRE
jgi:hypothetical protein